MSGFRIGSLFDNTPALPPSNTGLPDFAQARLDNIVSRAVQRHKNSLMVDGNPIYLWVRRPNGGLICTCQQKAQPLSSVDQAPAFNTNLRAPKSYKSSTQGIDGEIEFEVVHIRGYESDFSPPINNNNPLSQFVNNSQVPLEDLSTEPLDSASPLDRETLTNDRENTLAEDQRLALMLNEGGNAVWGGDKTICGICYQTGRTQGFQLANGHRLLLDASGEWPVQSNGGDIVRNKYPAIFKVTTTTWIQWTVDIPAFTNGWLVAVVRNNIQPAQNVRLDIMQNGIWVPLTTTLLQSTDGTDRRGSIIRAIAQNCDFTDIIEFTHAEIIYSTADPIPAQSPPLNISTNFDVFEPLIQTEFEVLAAIPDLSRESVFQDTKHKYLWKVLDVTPKMTSRGQVFTYTVNARMIHRSEMSFAMAIILQPNLVVNFQGLELIEGGILNDDFPNIPDTDQPDIITDDIVFDDYNGDFPSANGTISGGSGGGGSGNGDYILSDDNGQPILSDDNNGPFLVE